MAYVLVAHLVGAVLWILFIVAGVVTNDDKGGKVSLILKAFIVSVVWQVGTGMLLFVLSPNGSVWKLCAQLGLYMSVSFAYAFFLLRNIRWNRSQSVMVLRDNNNS